MMGNKSLLCLLLAVVAKQVSSGGYHEFNEHQDGHHNGHHNNDHNLPMPECDSKVKLTTGVPVTFSTPQNWPNIHLEPCKWVFKAKDDNAQVVITCQEFNVGERRQNDTCRGLVFKLKKKCNEEKKCTEKFCGMLGPMNEIAEDGKFKVVLKPKKNWWKVPNHFSCTATAVAPTITSSTTPESTSSPSSTTTNTPTTSLPEPCRCGRMGDPAKTRIVGGVNARLHNFPWQMALVLSSDLTKVICGGSLIDNMHVLTAAHCISGLPPGLLTVALGEHDTSRTDETSETIYRSINAFIIRNDFNPSTFENDIGLIRLSSPIDLNASAAIKPICFPDPNNLYVDESATVTGWGLLSTVGAQPAILQQVNVTIMNNADCQSFSSATAITENMICAAEPERDACQGDSGGPLIVKEGNHYVQAGIVSFGILCANPLVPGVYTRVGNYLDWINENVGDAMSCME